MFVCVYECAHGKQWLLEFPVSVFEIQHNTLLVKKLNKMQNNCFNNILIYIGKYHLNYILADVLHR